MLNTLCAWVQANTYSLKANLGRRQRGATMIEYVLIVAVISIAAIAVILLIGPKITTAFEAVDGGLDQAAGANP